MDIISIDNVRGEKIVESAANTWYIFGRSLRRLAHDTLDGVDVLKALIKM